VPFVGYDGTTPGMCYIVKKQRKRDAPVQLFSGNAGAELSGHWWSSHRRTGLIKLVQQRG
jgi:hypothetical protein